MFIQANLKHAYTFNSIRGAEDLFEQFEEDNILDVSTKNVNDIVIEAVKKIQRAYRTYRTKCSILLKKRVEDVVNYNVKHRPKSREFIGAQLSSEKLPFVDFTLLDEKHELEAEVRRYDRKRKKIFLQFKWHIASMLERHPKLVYMHAVAIQKHARGMLGRKHSFWKRVVKNKKVFNGYLEDMRQMVINEVVGEILDEDVGYLHDKYVESRQALVEGVDIKTQEDHELHDYAKPLCGMTRLCSSILKRAKSRHLPRGLDQLRAREKRKAKPYEPIEKLLKYIDPDEKGWFDLKDVTRFALDSVERDEMQPLLSLLTILSSKTTSTRQTIWDCF